MDLKDKRFWIPILMGVPIGILINLATKYLDIKFGYSPFERLNLNYGLVGGFCEERIINMIGR